jgi:pilin isopeptide linkage protein
LSFTIDGKTEKELKHMNRIIKTKSKVMLCAVTVLVMVMIAGLMAPMVAYAADNPLSFTIEQTSPSADVAFKYRLKSLEPDTPMPPGSTETGYTFTITGTGSKEIGPLNYGRQGVYRYELYQVIDAEKTGWTYDKRVYTIKVYVSEELTVSLVVINVDGTKEDEIRFENKYTVLPSDPNLMIDPPVKKTVSGNPAKDSSFIFRLTAQDVANPMPSGSTGSVKEITIMGSGTSEFGKWSYNKAGVYRYTVSEVNSAIKNYIYDTIVYTITDTVKDENGQLMVSRVVTDDTNQQTASLAFINKYSVADEGKPGGEGKPGPITGDDIKTALYYSMFVLGGIAAIGALIYLIAGKKRKKGDCHENQ